MNRDQLLTLSEEELVKLCKTDHYIATRNGGQVPSDEKVISILLCLN